jgi:hypothetical protein
VTATTPANAAVSVSTTTSVTVTFSGAMNPATITGSTFSLLDPSSNPVPATVSYNSATNTATLTPSSALAFSTTYTLRVQGGAGGVADAAGNLLAVTYTSFFTSAATSTIWPPTATPAVAAANDSSAVELGVKFQSSVTGKITGVRFYKGTTNTGTHLANL